MNPVEASALPNRRPRRIWRWLLIGAGASLAATALAAYSVVTLTKDAATLRDELLSTISPSARTQIQVTVGPVLLTAARTVISAFDGVPDEARLALRTVRDASVGVYKLAGATGPHERARIFSSADERMKQRGWSRVVGVSDDEHLVLVYVPSDEHSGSTEDVCVAVCSDENLVVVQGTVRIDRLVELVARKNLMARR